MITYKAWIDRIDNLITLIKELDYNDTISCSFNMKDLIELKLIITTCEQLAEKEGENCEKRLFDH